MHIRQIILPGRAGRAPQKFEGHEKASPKWREASVIRVNADAGTLESQTVEMGGWMVARGRGRLCLVERCEETARTRTTGPLQNDWLACFCDPRLSTNPCLSGQTGET